MDNINPIEYNPQDQSKWNKFGFFRGDSYLPYVFKKTEKISAALYMVSELLKDSEPLKWELRERGILMLSTALSMNGVEPIDKSALVQTFFTAAIEATTFLNVALIGGLISQMNHSILIREVDLIVALVKDRVAEDTTRAGYILSDAFFKTEELPFRSNSQDSQQARFAAGAVPNASDKASKNAGSVDLSSGVKDKKFERQDVIIELLKKDSNLTIKDFAKVVQDCSEKTIQRELLELVDKGVVLKIGERRWSRYSLK